MINKPIKTLINVSLGGVALRSIGDNFTGKLAPLGRATQSIVASGIALKEAKRYKLI